MYMQDGKRLFFKDMEALQEETGELKLGKAIARIMKGDTLNKEWIDEIFSANNDPSIY